MVSACLQSQRLKTVVVRMLVAVAVVVGVVGTSGGTADAHAALISSDPAYGAALDEAPTQVTFTFDNPVEPGLMRVRLQELDGDEIGSGELVGDRMPATEVTFTIPPHDEGAWSLVWTSFAFDGHIVAGTLPYTVGDVEPLFVTPGETGSGESGPPGEIIEIQLRFLSYLSLSALIGSLLLVWLARGNTAGVELVRNQARSVITVAAVVTAGLVAGRFGLLLWRLNLVDGLDQVPRLLAEGQLAIWPAAMFALVCCAALGALRPLWGLGLAAIVAMLLPATGHVTTYASPAVGSILAGGHLLAAGVWAGGLGVFAYATTAEQWASIEGRWQHVRGLLDKLAALWVAAFVVLAVTGARASWVFTDGNPDGRYATVLWSKLAAVGVLVGIAAVNALRRRRGKELNVYVLLGEAFVFVIIMVLAGVLASTSPG